MTQLGAPRRRQGPKLSPKPSAAKALHARHLAFPPSQANHHGTTKPYIYSTLPRQPPPIADASVSHISTSTTRPRQFSPSRRLFHTSRRRLLTLCATVDHPSSHTHTHLHNHVQHPCLRAAHFRGVSLKRLHRHHRTCSLTAEPALGNSAPPRSGVATPPHPMGRGRHRQRGHGQEVVKSLLHLPQATRVWRIFRRVL